MICQRSPEWYAWRKLGIGSSDSATVMGLTPWKTPYQLWLELTGQMEFPREINDAMQRGIDLEDEAREWACHHLNLKFEPDVRVHPKYDFIRSSLDGITADSRSILEIKCPGPRVWHKICKTDTIPPYYVAQMQHQLLTEPRAERVWFYAYVPFGICWHKELLPDQRYQENLVERLSVFWHCVQSKEWNYPWA